MEQLAVQNYGAFIGNAKVTQTVRSELTSIQKHLNDMAEVLAPLQKNIDDFTSASADFSTRRAALRNVKEQQGALLELLELPQLLDACIRNQMYDESLDLLSYCGNLLQAHEARGGAVPVLTMIREQVEVQRANLHTSLVNQLKTDIHLPACVRVIGFLRRIQRHSEEELRHLFIEHRGTFLDGQKQQVEVLRANRGSVVAALRTAADLLRTHVYDIGTQYRALFPSDDGPLCAWLSEQIMWLTALLQIHIGVPPSDAAAGDSKADGRRGSVGQKMSTSAATRIDAAALTTLLRHFMHASSTLKRLGGHFFPAVANIFEARMECLVCEHLDMALMTFQAELGRYDWVASTALASGGGVAAGAPPSGLTYLHPQALDLTRHRPLAGFTNDLVQMFNELRQCALFGLRAPVVSHTFQCLVGGVNLLKAVKGTYTFEPGSHKANEFKRCCQHLAHILTPLVSAHIEQIFGPSAKIDTAEILATMVPDLLPPSEAADPSLLIGMEDESTAVQDAGEEAPVGNTLGDAAAPVSEGTAAEVAAAVSVDSNPSLAAAPGVSSAAVNDVPAAPAQAPVVPAAPSPVTDVAPPPSAAGYPAEAQPPP